MDDMPTIDPCPVWCEGGYDAQHPDDRVHQNLGSSIPVIERRWVEAPNGFLRSEVEATTAHVSVRQRAETADTWVTLSTEQRSIELSIESMQRLLHEASAVLEVVRGTD